MSRDERVYNVFLSSPNDLLDERDSLEALIDELNSTWSRTLKARLELVRWEKDVIPGVGSDPQQLINAEMDKSFDIFIGMYWTRFGTPTPRTDSGSFEELTRALELSKTDFRKKILVYFKDMPINPSLIDPTQFLKVRDLKANIGKEKGVLYATFSSMDDFSGRLRMDLSKTLQSLVAEPEQKNESIAITKKEISEVEEADLDFGFLDYIEQGQAASEDVNEAMKKIISHLNTLKVRMEEGTNSANEITNKIGGNSGSPSLHEVRKAKSAVNWVAEGMNQFSENYESNFSDMTKGTDKMIGSFSKAMAIGVAFRPERGDIEKGTNMLFYVKNAMLDALLKPMVSYRQVVIGLPDMTSEIVRAKKKMVNVLKKGESQVRKLSDSIDAAIDSLNKLPTDTIRHVG